MSEKIRGWRLEYKEYGLGTAVELWWRRNLPIFAWLPRRVRALIKNTIHHRFGGMETCRNCSAQVTRVWRTDDDLWLRVNGSMWGSLCIDCFTRKAEGMEIYVEWLALESYREESE